MKYEIKEKIERREYLASLVRLNVITWTEYYCIKASEEELIKKAIDEDVKKILKSKIEGSDNNENN